MTPQNVSKELDILIRRKNGQMRELDPKKDNSDREYLIESEYQTKRFWILEKYGYTYLDASV